MNFIKNPFDLIAKLLELLVKLLEVQIKIFETFRRTISKHLKAETVNDLSSFVVHVVMILAAQGMMIVMLSIMGK